MRGGKRAKSSEVEGLGESRLQHTQEALPSSGLGVELPSSLGSLCIPRDTESLSASHTWVKPSSPSEDESQPSLSAKHSSRQEVEQVVRPCHHSRGMEAKAYLEGRRLKSLVVSPTPSKPHRSSQRHGSAASAHRHNTEPYIDQGMPGTLCPHPSESHSQGSEVDVVGVLSGSELERQRAKALRVLRLAHGGTTLGTKRARSPAQVGGSPSSPQSSDSDLTYRFGEKRGRKGRSLSTRGPTQCHRDRPKAQQPQEVLPETSKRTVSFLDLSKTGSVTLSADQLHSLVSMHESSSSSSDDSPSASRRWREFRSVVSRYNLDVPEPVAPRHQFHTQGPTGQSQSLTLETQRLPLFPTTSDTLNKCIEAIKSPRDPKTGYSGDPLAIGKFLEPQWPVSSKLDVLDIIFVNQLSMLL